MGLHYQIAGSYKPAVHLIGSETAKIGLELFGDGIVHEQVSDFVKQKREKSLPVWVIPDTKGKLKGKLHALRRFEFCRDVIMLVSEATPREYIDYLKERQYDYFVIGKEHVDLKQALELICARFGARRVLTDTGRVLSNLLMERGLVDELSLLIHPLVVGAKSYNMFGNMTQNPKLVLRKYEKLEKGFMWLVYRVVK
jgi:2,5-diamino-6-(ribosylamino)-4(3H)-pyrimidinone 5'-phosphate reductase